MRGETLVYAQNCANEPKSLANFPLCLCISRESAHFTSQLDDCGKCSKGPSAPSNNYLIFKLFNEEFFT